MKKYLLHFLFLIIFVGDLVGEFYQISWIDYSFKPFIMIWIAGYFLMYSKNINREVVRLALFAFLFSWLGDVLLMFSNRLPQFFILGLASFLVAQTGYVFLFRKTINLSGKKPFLKKKPYFLIFYIAYGLIVYIALFNRLDSVLRIAVFIYMSALLGMSSMALNRFGNGHPVSFSLVFAGSLLFVFSDTMIAINRFLVPVPYEGILVMSTYMVAQYLIMRGLLKQYE